MFPYKDDTPTQTFPFVTIGIIAINVLAYLWEILSPVGERYIIDNYGAIPSGLLSFEKTQALHPIATVFSSMFLHGGLLHVGGNMLYLWIFGDNIEDRLGHFRFFVFYLLSGLIASLTHIIMLPDSTLPMIGASGAIAGVLGAYFLLYPRAHVLTLVFFFFFVDIVKIPALVFLGLWFIFQLLSSGAGGGIAWYAHIGGFGAGGV